MNQPSVPSPEEDNRHAYRNVIEELVHKEIHRQLSHLPQNLAKYIDLVEVATYALNRVPPLYASSKRGRKLQEEKANEKLKQQIVMAVHQAIAAVQRDPLRSSTPLVSVQYAQYEIAKTCLRDLEKFLRDSSLIEPNAPDMDWDTLKVIVAKALKKAATQGVVLSPIEEVITEWEDQTYVPPVFDWQDPRYRF